MAEKVSSGDASATHSESTPSANDAGAPHRKEGQSGAPQEPPSAQIVKQR